MTNAIDLAEIIATSIRDHSPTTGMRVASGETCRCGYWNGNERAGKDRPVGCGGLTWHQAQEAAANILAAGYRNPHVVTIIEELLELKEGTVIRDDVGEVLCLQGREDYLDWFDQWGNCCHVNLPATVLHEPETPQELS